MIGGNNILLEVDESKFGTSKDNRGHSVDGAWVVDMVIKLHRGGLCKYLDEKRDTNTLTKIVRNYVHPCSIIS